MKEPKRCPICGHEAVLHSNYMMQNGHGYDATSYWFQCDHCKMIVGGRDWDMDKEVDACVSSAVDKWDEKVAEVVGWMKKNPYISFKNN